MARVMRKRSCLPKFGRKQGGTARFRPWYGNIPGIFAAPEAILKNHMYGEGDFYTMKGVLEEFFETVGMKKHPHYGPEVNFLLGDNRESSEDSRFPRWALSGEEE